MSARYAALAIGLFAVELAIALWVHDDFVRPYVGDVLVVPLIYCIVMTVHRGRPARVALAVFAFACAVELAQLAHVVDVLQIENRALRVIIGTTFAPADLVAYAVGSLLVYGCERAVARARGA